MSIQLSNRIRKAKNLTFTSTPGVKGSRFHTIDSQGDGYFIEFYRSISTDKSVSGRIYQHTTYTMSCQTEDWKRAKELDANALSSIVGCLGNGKSVCYHCLGLAIDQAKAHGYEYIGSTEVFEDVARLRNLGSTLIEVKSAQSGKSVWMVLKRIKTEKIEVEIKPVIIEVKPEVKSVISQMNFQERVNAMRGKVEEGIE